jgi:hypothetical protein
MKQHLQKFGFMEISDSYVYNTFKKWHWYVFYLYINL